MNKEIKEQLLDIEFHIYNLLRPNKGMQNLINNYFFIIIYSYFILKVAVGKG